jgi:hypothetical protein
MLENNKRGSMPTRNESKKNSQRDGALARYSSLAGKEKEGATIQPIMLP